MYEKILEEMLPPQRLYHCFCVSKQSKKLAKIYGADVHKAEIAGLLHDITKALPTDKHLKIIDKDGLRLDKIQKSSPKLLHSISGSIYVKKYLGITDKQIISAIRYHTTAKANMSLLEKIIYLADFTSEDRKFIDASYMREIVEHSLNNGMKFGLSYIIRELVNTSSPIHPDTFFAYNYYTQKY